MGIHSERIENAKSIGFFGLGISNEGAINYIKRAYPAKPLILRSDTEVPAQTLRRHKFARVLTGRAARESFCESVLFLSPTVRRDTPEISDASDMGVLLSSDLELFLDVIRRDFLTVSGTDGKSTLTYLISRLLNEAGISSAPVGNYGKSVLDVVNSDITPVIELSSFQLSYASPQSKISCLTNVFMDHADWHRSEDEYRRAKARVLENTRMAIADTDLVDLSLLPSRIFASVSLSQNKRARADIHVGYDGEYATVNGRRYADLRRALIRQTYNIRNYLHLTAVCVAEGIAPSILEKCVNRFRGIPHRCETVGVHGCIRYINSSIDTSPSRTLSTLSETEGSIALILGGRSKGLSLNALSEYIIRRDIPCVLIGECRYEYEAALTDARTVHAYGMDEAVCYAARLLPLGGTVLLSPAAQSFGDYADFAARGEDFRRAVNEYIGK